MFTLKSRQRIIKQRPNTFPFHCTAHTFVETDGLNCYLCQTRTFVRGFSRIWIRKYFIIYWHLCNQTVTHMEIGDSQVWLKIGQFKLTIRHFFLSGIVRAQYLKLFLAVQDCKLGCKVESCAYLFIFPTYFCLHTFVTCCGVRLLARERYLGVSGVDLHRCISTQR